MGDVTTNPALLLNVPMVTEFDAALVILLVASAVAVITEPGEMLNPVFVHAPDELLVVVPKEVTPEKSSITVPLASVVVPEIDEMVVAVQ
jgi:hypothetical protein